ncbi:hypothetical protein FE634_04120 [Nocardioides dongxiaopingii]|uniref:hypothetical protein n=1 Tax=Nocardioides sp. S-1144 TaxID=2582905 RepID=UPI00116546E5|nr:hypothetical protein [Nocardioides sp. S-1144]QCW49798.2 hypothetical protein FE634_04120 [Nocardioides sp. S-1144]
MRTVVALALLLILGACSPGRAEPQEGLGSTTPTHAAVTTRPASPDPSGYPGDVVRLPRDLSDLPRLRTRLPRAVPSDPAALPSLLSDPPGRALFAHHPPEGRGDTPGWSGETVLLLGADRRWRRLDLGDLGLAEAAHPGPDTYGAGNLSPDGRWWAGRSRAGVVLLDLRTGEHRVVDTGTDWVSEVRWLADSSGYDVVDGVRGRSQRVTVPSLEVTELPYRLWQVGTEPDGTVLSLRRVEAGTAELVEHVGGDVVVRGRLSIPGLGRGVTRLRAVVPTEGRFAVGHQPRPLDFRRVEIVVVDTESQRVEHVLRLDNRGYTVREWSWLDPRTLLVGTDDGVLAWRPDEGRLLRVVDVPVAPRDRYWTWAAAGAPVGGSATGS